MHFEMIASDFCVFEKTNIFLTGSERQKKSLMKNLRF